MSGESFIDNCVRCGNEDSSYGYLNWKPYDQFSSICLSCGFEVNTITEIATLDKVNEVRKEHDLAPLEELVKPLEDWLESGYEPRKVTEGFVMLTKKEEALKASDEAWEAYIEAGKASKEAGGAFLEAWKAFNEAWEAYEEAKIAYEKVE